MGGEGGKLDQNLKRFVSLEGLRCVGMNAEVVNILYKAFLSGLETQNQ